MSSREAQNPITRRSTRSGRRVREPVRYEPDPNVVLEDDYGDDEHSDSDTLSETYSDDCSLSGNPESDDEDFVSEIGDSDDESEFDTDEEPMTDVVEEEEELEELEEPDDDLDDDIIDFDCLTENASDCSMSSDDEY